MSSRLKRNCTDNWCSHQAADADGIVLSSGLHLWLQSVSCDDFVKNLQIAWANSFMTVLLRCKTFIYLVLVNG